MKSVLVCVTLLYTHAVFSRISFPKNVIIEIPSTLKGNLEARYVGISPNFTSQEAEEYYKREFPGYKKFVTEQIKLEEEEKRQRPSRKIPNTEEILASLGSWGHYYDYKTKEIASWERRNPPGINQMSLVSHYKQLKAQVIEKQKMRALNRTTDFYPGMKEEVSKMRAWAEEEIKAGRMVCECDNCTGPTKFTERYSLPGKGGKWVDGMFSLEKE